MIDDYLMQISHVMRAEEWLPSLPKHVNIYKSLEWEMPLFVHLPMILAKDKTKLKIIDIHLKFDKPFMRAFAK